MPHKSVRTEPKGKTLAAREVYLMTELREAGITSRAMLDPDTHAPYSGSATAFVALQKRRDMLNKELTELRASRLAARATPVSAQEAVRQLIASVGEMPMPVVEALAQACRERIGEPELGAPGVRLVVHE